MQQAEDVPARAAASGTVARGLRALALAATASLKIKLAFIMVTLLGITISIAPWSAIRIQQRQLLEASEDRLLALHELVRKTFVETSAISGNIGAVQQVLERIANHNDIYGARILSPQGVVRFASDPGERGAVVPRQELAELYGHDRPIVRTQGAVLTHTLVRPLFNDSACTSCHPPESKILGVLQVSLSLEPMQRRISELRGFAVRATLITLTVIALGIWLALTYLVDQPLQQLMAVMTRAESGDLTVRAPEQSSDEIGKLSRHFNAMLATLHQARGELELYHQNQLERSERLATIGEMAAALAHEIRNPLTGISGVLSVLRRDLQRDDPRREVVGQAHQLIERLNRSIEDLLRYARPSPPQLQPVHIEALIGETLPLVKGAAEKAGVSLLYEAGDDVPSITADPHQLQQVLMNLILNAVQASPGGAAVRIRAFRAAFDGGAGACVAIDDEGKGMSEHEVEHAFQPFFTTKAQGTGLGLPIARQIIERHHGRITLESSAGRGTHVSMEFPAAPGA